MRSRPRVKLTLAPREIPPGTSFVAEAHLESASETPVEFIELRLEGFEQLYVGQGNARRARRLDLVSLASRHTPGKLAPGTHRFSARFDVPPRVPGAFVGVEASVQYLLTVHVSIPWWPDRRVTYLVPVGWAPRTIGPPAPQTFATNTAGPSGGEPYMEAALDRVEVIAGEAVSGSVSLTNVARLKIRALRATILGIEGGKVSGANEHTVTKLGAQIHAGAIGEGEPLKFALAFPAHIPPSFDAQLFGMRYLLELRADVAWGSDVVMRLPIVVHPTDARLRTRTGYVAPVGKERRAIVWNEVATRLGLENDPHDERMLASVGDVSLVVQLAQRARDTYVSATVRFSHLGVDLVVSERAWTSLFGDHVDVEHDKASRRFTIHAREHAQAKALLGPALLDALAEIDEVEIDDDGARLASRGNAQVGARLTEIVARFQIVARELAVAIPRLPPPAAMAAHLPAWEAFAARAHGRLERGRMWIRGAWGADPVEVGTLLGEHGEIVGTRIAVTLDPPIDVAIDSPTVSPAARAELTALVADAKTDISPNALAVLLAEGTPDPATLEPWLERLCRAARALRGQTQAGPFR